MSVHAQSKAWTVPALAQAKAQGRRLAMLTAYDAGFARVLDRNGIDLVLVGDSLGMVVQGHGSTLPVSVADIAYHTAAVISFVRPVGTHSSTSRLAPAAATARASASSCAAAACSRPCTL